MENADLEVLCCFCGQDSTFNKAIEITIECDKKMPVPVTIISLIETNTSNNAKLSNRDNHSN